MKSGNIKQYAHLSEFTTVEQFNESNQRFLEKYEGKFTKGERLAFDVLTRFSVKEIGICNARVCKLVQAAQSQKGGISRSTFERMLRKAKQLGIITIYNTIREQGGYSHNVYVFHRFDRTDRHKLTDRQTPKNEAPPTIQSPKKPQETINLENKKITEIHRPIHLESLDYTFVPSYVPDQFTRNVKPFFSTAKKICELWDRALIAYRSMKFYEPIEEFLPTIIKAFKETVYKWKRKKIEKSFITYYYGTVAGMLAVEKRKQVASQNSFYDWLAIE